MKKITLSLLLCFGFNGLASAAPVTSVIEHAVQPLLQGAQIEKIEFSNRLSLYEVVTDKGVFYTDKVGSYVIFGSAVDTKTKRDLTAERVEQLGAFDFNKLPVEDAIKTVHGDGSRKLVTFEDPNCGYCKKLMHELVKVDNVTIYTFLIPILSPDSGEKSKAAWCASDRSKVWTEFMLNGASLPDNKACALPLERNAALQKKLRITGTPAMLFRDNTRAPGYISAEKIEERLTKAK